MKHLQDQSIPSSVLTQEKDLLRKINQWLVFILKDVVLFLDFLG